MITTDGGDGVRHHAHRDRGASARSQPDQDGCSPRFNVLMRDDKSFPYILITGNHEAPGIFKHRGAQIEKRRLFRALSRRQRPSGGRSTRCSAPSCFEPVPTASMRAERGPACSTRSSAVRRARVPVKSRSEGYAEAGQGSQGVSLRPQPGSVQNGDVEDDAGGGRKPRFRARRRLSRPHFGTDGDPEPPGHQSADRSRKPTSSPSSNKAA